MFIIALHLLFVYLINTCLSYENRDCANCKWFISYKNKQLQELGLCRMFSNRIYNANNTDKVIYNFAGHCRDDNTLCGTTGILFEKKDSEIKLIEQKNNTYDKTENSNDNMSNEYESLFGIELMKLINEYANFIMRNNNNNDW
jgi:hypothetical protein